MQPNILQITCHDLGRHLGCYGVPSVVSPRLDRLAAEGVLCLDAFATAPGCSPARASLCTGRYPHQNGVMGLAHDAFGWSLHATEVPIARKLKQAGYHTALFGLQHVTYDEAMLGFDVICSERPAEAVVENFRRVLPTLQAPWYVEVNHQEPHRPFDFGGVTEDRRRGVHVPAWLPHTAEVEAELALCQGAIHKMDAHVGMLLDAVDAENTMVVFMPDHGLPFPFAKGTLYDPGIEVALIVRWPAGGISGGTRRRGLVSNVDIFPTLGGGEGSLLPFLRGESAGRDAIFAEKTYHEEYDPIRCIRTNTHKLIVNFEVGHAAEVPGDCMEGGTYRAVIEQVRFGRPPVETYDLAADPLERTNLPPDPDLLQRLHAWMEATHDPLLQGPIPSPFYQRAMGLLRGERDVTTTRPPC